MRDAFDRPLNKGDYVLARVGGMVVLGKVISAGRVVTVSTEGTTVELREPRLVALVSPPVAEELKRLAEKSSDEFAERLSEYCEETGWPSR